MKTKFLITMLILPLSIFSAYAEDMSNGPAITVSGFGTAALTRSNSENAEFARYNQLTGVKKDAKTGVDSNFGIQATAQVNDWLSLTTQGLVRKSVVDEFVGRIEWAFVKAKVSDNLSLRAGRIGLPVFMVSELRNVGYANTMMRPPVEMYNQVPMESLDGIDAVYQRSYGDTTFTGQLSLGSSSSKNSGGYTIKDTKLVNINLVAENGPFTFRFGRSDGKINVDGPNGTASLVAAFRRIAATPGSGPVLDQLYGLTTAANSLEIKDTKASFTSLGFGLDWKNLVVQAEYGKRVTTSLAVADTSSWYTMFGYRLGSFLPYYNHASATQDSARSIPGLPVAGPAQLLALTAAANRITSTLSPLQTSNTVGVRWDFYKSAALKMQIDRISPKNGPGTFVNTKPNFTGPVTVFAAGIDFVF